MTRLEERAGEAGLSVQQLRLLGILRDREPTVSELTVHLGLDKSSVSGLVIRAERRGLVRRTPDAVDGRSVRVQLQPHGRALIDQVTARHGNEFARAFAALDPAALALWMDLTRRLIAAQRNP
ncbi:MarR family transcriptional regulator [Protaetiibacter intestinalis]|uniref:MarR family transcriptional regulator n=2 Tax=Protaetiibacter intestinalis TaxID=2419774 RepID=A0A387BEA5_9MICO|nr:MarR family transcriptional regulator [Protaetiibacter intestinalis]